MGAGSGWLGYWGAGSERNWMRGGRRGIGEGFWACKRRRDGGFGSRLWWAAVAGYGFSGVAGEGASSSPAEAFDARRRGSAAVPGEGGRQRQKWPVGIDLRD